MPDRATEQYEKQKAASRAWKKANAERHAEIARGYRARNPEKTLAQNRLNYAIKKGLVERQPCEKCGTGNRVHAHHDDYGRPLDVRWLCYLCHKDEHPPTDEHRRIKFEDATPARLFGEENPNSKLSNIDRRKILEMLEEGYTQVAVAKRFGITQKTVSHIKRTYVLE